MSWYLLISSVFLLGILLVIYIALKCYKKRMRNDGDHNEQIFIIHNATTAPSNSMHGSL